MICEIPTAIEGDFFFTDLFRTPIDKAVLYVHEASFDSYRTTSPWSDFGKILTITSTGIKNNAAEKSTSIDSIYDLGGKRSNGMGHGMNIIRMADGTTKKVMK